VAAIRAYVPEFAASEARWYRGPIVAMLDSTFITKVPTTNQSHEVGYDQTNRVVYALGGGLVAFTIPFCALHRFQSTTGAQPLRSRWLSSTGSGMRSSNRTL